MGTSLNFVGYSLTWREVATTYLEINVVHPEDSKPFGYAESPLIYDTSQEHRDQITCGSGARRVQQYVNIWIRRIEYGWIGSGQVRRLTQAYKSRNLGVPDVGWRTDLGKKRVGGVAKKDSIDAETCVEKGLMRILFGVTDATEL